MGFYNSSIRNDLCKPHTVLQMRTLKSERRSNEADPLPAFRNHFEKDVFILGLQLGLNEIYTPGMKHLAVSILILQKEV